MYLAIEEVEGLLVGIYKVRGDLRIGINPPNAYNVNTVMLDQRLR